MIRANTMLFLIGYDLLILCLFLVKGLLLLAPLVLGIILILPNLLGNMAGAAIFRPELEKTYRVVAYAVIAASAISGLPIWNG